MTPSPEPMSPSSKQQGVLKWKCLGFYVTSQLMWRQTPNLFITATEITQTGYSTKKSSNRSIFPYVLRDACHEIFCVFGDFSASRTQDAEVTKSLHCRKKFTVLWSSIVIHKVLVCGSPCKVDSWLPGSAVNWPANTLYWPVWEKTKYWMLWRVMNYGEVLGCKVRPQVKKIITK